MANESPNLGFVNENYGSITTLAATGIMVEGTAAVQLPDVACKLVRFRAFTSNPTDVFIGKSTVEAEGTVTSTVVGWKLEPGDDTGWIPLPNLNKFYTISEGTTNALGYMAIT